MVVTHECASLVTVCKSQRKGLGRDEVFKKGFTEKENANKTPEEVKEQGLAFLGQQHLLAERV